MKISYEIKEILTKIKIERKKLFKNFIIFHFSGLKLEQKIITA